MVTYPKMPQFFPNSAPWSMAEPRHVSRLCGDDLYEIGRQQVSDRWFAVAGSCSEWTMCKCLRTADVHIKWHQGVSCPIAWGYMITGTFYTPDCRLLHSWPCQHFFFKNGQRRFLKVLPISHGVMAVVFVGIY